MTDLDLAELRAAEARERLNGTLGTLQARLAPRVVARDAIDGLTRSGGKALAVGVDTAARHPGKIAGAAALVVAILARRRLRGVFGKIFGQGDTPPKPVAPQRVRSTTRPARPPERTFE